MLAAWYLDSHIFHNDNCPYKSYKSRDQNEETDSTLTRNSACKVSGGSRLEGDE
jgi:hypothetical protein